jgi:hypothetical protein
LVWAQTFTLAARFKALRNINQINARSLNMKTMSQTRKVCLAASITLFSFVVASNASAQALPLDGYDQGYADPRIDSEMTANELRVEQKHRYTYEDYMQDQLEPVMDTLAGIYGPGPATETFLQDATEVIQNGYDGRPDHPVVQAGRTVLMSPGVGAGTIAAGAIDGLDYIVTTPVLDGIDAYHQARQPSYEDYRRMHQERRAAELTRLSQEMMPSTSIDEPVKTNSQPSYMDYFDTFSGKEGISASPQSGSAQNVSNSNGREYCGQMREAMAMADQYQLRPGDANYGQWKHYYDVAKRTMNRTCN